MLRWCAYCQHFLGEIEPFSDFSITHGLCTGCSHLARTWNKSDGDKLRPILDFYHRLREQARAGTLSASKILRESREMSIPPMDLIMGVLQPLLYEIGELWNRGQVTVAVEHRFSSVVSALLEQILAESGPLPNSSAPTLLLVPTDGNFHCLGTQMIELALAYHGLTCLAIRPGLPPEEVEWLTRDLKPRFVGLSISMAEQIPALVDTCERLSALEERTRPTVLVGGLAVRSKQQLGLPASVVALNDVPSLLIALAN